MEYNKEYFINKINAIPDKEIGRITLDNHCILWHCGVRKGGENEGYVMTEESLALIRLFQTSPVWDEDYKQAFVELPDHPRAVYTINDTRDVVDKNSPKERLLYILNTLD